MTTSDLSPNESRAISALLVATTQRQAAELAGVSDRTLRRYLADPGFCAALAAAEADLIAQTVRGLAGLQAEAVAVAAALMRDETQTPSARLRAASLLVDACQTLREAWLMETKLNALEDRIGKPV